MNKKTCFFIILTSAFLLNFKIQAQPQPQLPFSEEKQDITHANVTATFEKYMKEDDDFLNSSEGKDIVAFFGKTGSGKSTLINYLNEKPLTVSRTGTIVLSDPSDVTAMKIGTGAQSETLLPQLIMHQQNLLFCDLPGLSDTRGTAINLVNACCIKSLFEKANSVRLIFVVGQDEMMAERGRLFKEFFDAIEQLLPQNQQDTRNFSSLIVTKSRVGFNTQQLIERLEELTEPDVLRPWIASERLTHMSDTLGNEINQSDRSEIVEIIKKTPNIKVDNVNIGAIFNNQGTKNIEDIHIKEINNIFNLLISNKLNINDNNYISSLNKNNLIELHDYFKNNFFDLLNESINNSKLINLLRQFSENIYQSCWDKIKANKQLKIENIIEQIKTRQAQISEEEAQTKAQIAEANLAAKQQQIFILEQEAYNNDPKNWIPSTERKTEECVFWSTTPRLGEKENYFRKKGFSSRNVNRWPYIQDEMRVSITYEQTSFTKPGTDKKVSQGWLEISRTEPQPTGKTQKTGNYAY